MKQIVWAKVSNYPWWPARVSFSFYHRLLVVLLNNIENYTKLTSSVILHSTYLGLYSCYLEDRYLLNFESGLIRSRDESDDFKLEKPL